MNETKQRATPSSWGKSRENLGWNRRGFASDSPKLAPPKQTSPTPSNCHSSTIPYEFPEAVSELPSILRLQVSPPWLSWLSFVGRLILSVAARWFLEPRLDLTCSRTPPCMRIRGIHKYIDFGVLTCFATQLRFIIDFSKFKFSRTLLVSLDTLLGLSISWIFST